VIGVHGHETAESCGVDEIPGQRSIDGV